MRDRSDWMLNLLVFQRVLDHFPFLEVDLFATRLTFQLPLFFSWRPDPLAEATDAFLQDWRDPKAFANPSWNFRGRVLSKVEGQEAEVVLIVPIWPSQPWYPRLLGHLMSLPPRTDTQAEVIKGAMAKLSPALSCVAYLKQHYTSQKLLGEATELLLSTWR